MKKFGVYISDDQVDYITAFDYTDLEYAKELGIIPLKHINNPNLFFDTGEEAREAVEELNKVIKSDDYYKTSEKIDILLKFLEID